VWILLVTDVRFVMQGASGSLVSLNISRNRIGSEQAAALKQACGAKSIVLLY
jgi:hypothetical protein